MVFQLNQAANSFKWRIALTESGLATGSFYNYGLPAPEVASPRDHSAQVSQSEGGQALHGWHKIPFLFPSISETKAWELIRLLRQARPSLLYMTVWTGAGYDENGPRWIDVQGKVHLPQEVAPTGMVGRYGQLVHDLVSFELRNFTVINDPSSYSD